VPSFLKNTGASPPFSASKASRSILRPVLSAA
jgi:hypothetical protein